jgi:hypothetical protein
VRVHIGELELRGHRVHIHATAQDDASRDYALREITHTLNVLRHGWLKRGFRFQFVIHMPKWRTGKSPDAVRPPKRLPESSATR